MEQPEWRSNLLTRPEEIAGAIRDSKTIAVLGIKPERLSGEPSHYVPHYMQSAGYDIIPVPVYYPEVTEILGRAVFRKLADIGRPIDMVNVFRRSYDIPPHVDDIIAARPKYVWFQLGIRNDAAAEQLARSGIRVVQNRCLMVDHQML
ncbi:MAG TPA: CoA-binding protein [Thermoanaerobaculia bacterium]|nr:CoA-binding protein [Thermoanaerobaculia bacterium]